MIVGFPPVDIVMADVFVAVRNTNFRLYLLGINAIKGFADGLVHYQIIPELVIICETKNSLGILNSQKRSSILENTSTRPGADGTE